MGCLSLGGGLDREKWEKHSKSLIREVRGSGWFPRKAQGQRPEGRAKGASGCGPKQESVTELMWPPQRSPTASPPGLHS